MNSISREIFQLTGCGYMGIIPSFKLSEFFSSFPEVLMKYPLQHKPTPATNRVAARIGCMCQIFRAPLFVVVITSAGSTR